MHRLIWGFAGGTYQIVGNLMLRLKLRIRKGGKNLKSWCHYWDLSFAVKLQSVKSQATFPSKMIWEHIGSVVECLTWDQGAAGLSLNGVTALCPWARHINPSLVLVQPRKTRPYITERLLMGRKESNQTKANKTSQKWLIFCNENTMFKIA